MYKEALEITRDMLWIERSRKGTPDKSAWGEWKWNWEIEDKESEENWNGKSGWAAE